MAGLLDYLEQFYANDGLSGLLGMKSAGKQMEENDAKVKALAEEGQGPMLNREQFAAMMDNPMVFALGTGNVGKVTPQMLNKLPMDEASRMARAKAMGFDIHKVWHRGTVNKGERVASKSIEAGDGVFMTDNPDVAEIFRYPREYGEVLFDQRPGDLQKLFTRAKNPMVVDKAHGFDGQKFSYDTSYQVEVIKKAKELGHDSLIVPNIMEGVGDVVEPGTTFIALNPAAVRKSSAAFDPSKKDSSDLLASIGLLGLIGGGAALTDGE